MSEKTFFAIVAVLFGVVAVLHLVRLLVGWSVLVDTWAVPMWVSWVGLIVAGALSYFGTKFATR